MSQNLSVLADPCESSRYYMAKNVYNSLKELNVSCSFNDFGHSDEDISLCKGNSSLKVIQFAALSGHVSVSGSQIREMKKYRAIASFDKATNELLRSYGVNSSFVGVPFKRRTNNSSFNFELSEKYNFLTMSGDDFRGCPDSVRAFYKTFTSKDDVRMIVKFHGSNFNIHWQSRLIREVYKEKLKHRYPPEVIVFSSSMSETEIDGLFDLCNCYVKVRGIDSGISFLKAIERGAVCIAPENSLLSSNNSLIVSSSGREKTENGGVVSSFSDDKISECMEYAYKTDCLKDKFLKERKMILSNSDANLSAINIVKILKKL